MRCFVKRAANFGSDLHRLSQEVPPTLAADLKTKIRIALAVASMLWQ